MKLGLPVKPTPVTVRSMRALQVMERGAETLPIAVLGNSYGEEQFRGKLTGEPNAYRYP